MAKFIDVAGFGHHLVCFVRSRSFRYDDNCKLFPSVDPFSDERANFIDVEFPLGNENAIGSPGHAGMRRDPPGVTTHDFNNHNPLVRLGCCVEAVDSLRDDLNGRIETEGVIRTCKIVIDSLRDADDGIAFLAEEFVRDALRIIPANSYQIIQAKPLPVELKLLNIFKIFEWIGAGSSKYCAAPGQDPAH